MTREAKIGMLTGLGVILLIGVLLSNYLGTGTGPAPTARMAPLSIGAGYRQEVMQPVVPPGTTPETQSENGSAVAITYTTNEDASATLVPAAYASNTTDGAAVSGPTMGRAVTPVAVGPGAGWCAGGWQPANDCIGRSTRDYSNTCSGRWRNGSCESSDGKHDLRNRLWRYPDEDRAQVLRKRWDASGCATDRGGKPLSVKRCEHDTYRRQEIDNYECGGGIGASFAQAYTASGRSGKVQKCRR